MLELLRLFYFKTGHAESAVRHMLLLSIRCYLVYALGRNVLCFNVCLLPLSRNNKSLPTVPVAAISKKPFLAAHNG